MFNYLLIFLIVKKIGKLKLQHTIQKAYFITNKTYALKTNKGKYLIKTKGVWCLL